MADATATFVKDLAAIQATSEAIFADLKLVLAEVERAVQSKDLTQLAAIASEVSEGNRLTELPDDARTLFTTLFQSLKRIPAPPKNFFNQIKWALGLGDPLKEWRENTARPFEAKWTYQEEQP